MSRLRFIVKPGCRENQIGKDADGNLFLKIAAPAQDGKANKEIIRFLSAMLKIPTSAISIHSGQTSRYKFIEFEVEEDMLKDRMDFLIAC
jgi:uncharacterized protein (TIGR00251 family)